MKLLKLTIKNFKGIRSFVLEPKGADAYVFGDNGTGKTTLFDADAWVLTGKDSLGRADFEIKTLNKAGQPLSNLDHEVELVLDLGDDEVVLKKVYKEVWTKKRGSAKAERTGHTTDHYIDGVPVQKKEFDGRVAEIAPEGTFRLLTDPAAFPNLHWQKQREILLGVCGDVSDADVIASNTDLSGLTEILGKRTLVELRKVLGARKREINQKLTELPARIDEVEQGLPELPSTGDKQLEADLATLREEWQEIEQERARIQAGGQVAEKQKRLSEIKSELAEVERKARGAMDARLREFKQAAGAAQDRVDAKARELRRLEEELVDVDARLGRLDAELERLRTEWQAIDSRKFSAEHDENCPVCGQALPADQIEAAHRKALEEFNAKRSKELETNKTAGLAAKAERDKLESKVEDLRAAIVEATAELESLKGEAEKASGEVERLEKALPDMSTNPAHQKLVAEQQQVEAAIEQLREGNTAALDENTSRSTDLNTRMSELEAAIGTFGQRERGEARIKQLKNEEEDLATEFETIEHQIHLCQLFIRSKVDLLTDRINSKFELTQFKLFEEQINGGLADACEAVHGGVPYGSLNHGARIQVGLDIVRTLQAHYGLFPPVWVDNRESVTSLPDMSCQVISLFVSEADKKLRVETAPKPEEVVA